jgi:fatty aldehyde-generating acyl-ACP reductase
MRHKVCIVIHPITRELLYSYEPGMRRLSADVANKLLEWMSPFKASNIEGIKSFATGDRLYGELIMCPLLMEQMVSMRPRKLFRQVVRAVEFARQREAEITALVAYTALVGGRGQKIYDKTRTPLTTGNHLTLATIPEAILKAIDLMGYNPGNLNMLLLGANPLIYTLVRTLGNSLKQFYLYYPARDKLRVYYTVLPSVLKKKVKILSYDPRRSLNEMDIVVNATRRLPSAFDEKRLKSGAIVFDASYPRSIHITRNDVLLMDGITMIAPGNPKFNFNFGLPEGLCFPCMAEPMILAFEKRYESYSIGKEFSIDKTNEIFKLALKHGFKMGPLTSYERVISQDTIMNVVKGTVRKKLFTFI